LEPTTPTNFCIRTAMCGHYREDVRTRFTLHPPFLGTEEARVWTAIHLELRSTRLHLVSLAQTLPLARDLPFERVEPPSSCRVWHRLVAPAFAITTQSFAGKRRGDRESRFFRRFTPLRRAACEGCCCMATAGRNASWQPPRYPCHRSPSPGTNGLREASRDRPRSAIVRRSAKSHPRTAGRGTFHRGRPRA